VGVAAPLCGPGLGRSLAWVATLLSITERDGGTWVTEWRPATRAELAASDSSWPSAPALAAIGRCGS